MKFYEYLQKLRKDNNKDRLFSLIYGLLDTMVIVFAFFPFYGQQDSKIIYFAMLIIISLFGMIQLIIQFFQNKKGLKYSKVISICLHTCALIFFAVTRQVYVNSYFYVIFILKIILLVEEVKNR